MWQLWRVWAGLCALITSVLVSLSCHYLAWAWISFVCLFVCFLVVCLETGDLFSSHWVIPDFCACSINSEKAVGVSSRVWVGLSCEVRLEKKKRPAGNKQKQQTTWRRFTDLCSCSASYSKIKSDRLDKGWSTFHKSLLYDLISSVSSLCSNREPLEFQMWTNYAIWWTFVSFPAGDFWNTVGDIFELNTQ